MAEESKKMDSGFVFQPTYFQTALKFSGRDFEKFLLILIKYGLEGAEPDFSGLSKGSRMAAETCFIPIRAEIDRSKKRYAAAVQNGKRGGRPSKSQKLGENNQPRNQTGNQARNQPQNQTENLNKNRINPYSPTGNKVISDSSSPDAKASETGESRSVEDVAEALKNAAAMAKAERSREAGARADAWERERQADRAKREMIKGKLR